jgi:hypothetical protein
VNQPNFPLLGRLETEFNHMASGPTNNAETVKQMKEAAQDAKASVSYGGQ